MAAGLVIFDCDGVLIDSEIIFCRVGAEELSRNGFPITWREIAERYSGIPTASMHAMIGESEGRPVPKDLRQLIRRRVHQEVRANLAPVPGVHRALEGLEAPVCVASSSGLEYLGIALEKVDLQRFFEPHVFSVEHVERGKPAPDIFLHAAAEMRVPPADCLVIEDSVAGVTAARAAAMRVYGFAGASHCGPEHPTALSESGAELVFGEMTELPSLIAEAG